MLSRGTIAAAIEGSLVDTARAYSRPDVPAGCMIVLGANPDASEVEAVGDDIKSRRTENISQLMKKFERAISEGELAGTFGCKAAAVFFATPQKACRCLPVTAAETMC